MYEFLLNKLLLVFIASNTYLGTEFDLPRYDLIILNNGDEVKCQVEDIQDAIVRANTKNGEITIIREINVTSARDIVETGMIKNKRYSGRITYFGPEYLEMETYGGTMKIKRRLVRKIIISQEPSLNL